MLSASELNAIEQRLSVEAARVFIMDIDGQKLVIKRQEAARPEWRYRVLRMCAALFREPLLIPAHVPGGSAAQAIEVARIRRLSQAGVPVPELLHVDVDWIAISYLGKNNLRDMMNTGSLAACHYWEQALAAILDAHQRRQNLSQAFFRNLMYHEDKVVFIDFEDDPEVSMGLVLAQARDWAFFLFSSTWLVGLPPKAAAEVFWQYIQQDTPEVQAAMLHLVKTTGWLRFLPKKRKPWGRDVMAAQAYAQLLFEFKKLCEVQKA